MAALIDLRQRIKGVKSTQKITKAMKMVAAARMRRAQSDILAARPYATHMRDMLDSLTRRVNPTNHPLLRVRGDENIELVIVTGDKGLCGSFNTNIIKQSEDFLEARKSDKKLYLNLVGRKGRDFFKKRNFNIKHEYVGIYNDLNYDYAIQIADQMIQEYTEKQLDAVYMVYNEFKSVLQQRVVVERLLPIGEIDMDSSNDDVDYIYEPTETEILEQLIPLHIRTQVWRVLLESNAAEQAARMNAMENATNNAQDIIESLTLKMNKLRQQTITTQLIEVVSGADALKG
ncbi:MAG: ATP synthase F1 subunit gamma [Acidobacteria bacterium]|nr:ATP synthase F1 subunit gamma [Acidobacteriota bacterium]